MEKLEEGDRKTHDIKYNREAMGNLAQIEDIQFAKKPDNCCKQVRSGR